MLTSIGVVDGSMPIAGALWRTCSRGSKRARSWRTRVCHVAHLCEHRTCEPTNLLRSWPSWLRGAGGFNSRRLADYRCPLFGPGASLCERHLHGGIAYDYTFKISRSQGAQGQAHQPEPSRSEEPTSELQSLMRISYAVSCLKQNTTT